MSPCSTGRSSCERARARVEWAARAAHHPNPDALAQLAAYVAQPVDSVEAERLKPPVAKHARDLGVLCVHRVEAR